MPQRLTTSRQLYYGKETSTEGVEVLGGNSNVVTLTNLVVGPDISLNSRTALGQIGRLKGVIGAQNAPGLSFTVQCRGGGTTVVPKLDPLLSVIFNEGAAADAGDQTVAADSTTTVLKMTSSSGFSVGNAVAVETGNGTNVYEVGWVAARDTGSSPNTLTLTHALTFPSAPAVGAKIKPSITYKPSTTGHKSISFQLWLDQYVRVRFLGCKGSMKFDTPAPGAVPTMTFSWSAMSWDVIDDANERPSSPAWDTATSPTSYKFKLNATPYDTKLAHWDLRQMIARKRSQNSDTGTIAQLVTNRDAAGVIQPYDVDDSNFADWRAGTEQAIAHQFGSTLNNIVAYQMPRAQRRRVSYGDDAGLTTDRVTFNANVATGAEEVKLAFL